MAISLSETSPAQWKYISEGGATIVFSYHGPHHPILTGKALRLRKTSRKPEGLRKLEPISDDQTIIFQQKIISRLLDSSYLPELHVVALQAAWVEAFSIHHESFRPQKRRSVSMIDCSRRTGVLAPDLIGGSPCAVEVKVNSHSSSRKYSNDNFSKSRNGVSCPILSTCHQRVNRSKIIHAGPVCTLT
jgi:inositol-pentakisphosphate 2-kinase